MSVLSTPTFTFGDGATKDAAWEDFCGALGLSFMDAADAETVGTQALKDYFVQKIAEFRSLQASATQYSSTYSTTQSDLSGL